MTQKEAKKFCLEIIGLKEAIKESRENGEDVLERRVYNNEKRELECSLRKFLMYSGLGAECDWDDSKKTLIACGFSANQAGFILAANQQEISLTSYSGRGMYGEYCPATHEEIKFKGSVCIDTLGLGAIYYVRY